MTDLQWLESYTDQTPEQLIALANTHRVDSIVLAFEEALQRKVDRVGLAGLSEAEVTILAVEALEREVNNGGYHQFFLNTPEYVSAIVAALMRIGCPKTAEVSDHAIRQLNLPPSFTADEVEAALMADVEGQFAAVLSESCDALFYECGEAIADHLFEYIQQNSQAIRLPA